MRKSLSLNIFKRNLFSFYNFPAPNFLFYFGERLPSIHHCRLRLQNSTLNKDLYSKNCVPSPACPRCGHPVEDVKHYFFHCPSYAAIRASLLTSAEQLLGDKWQSTSIKRKINWFLNGVPTVNNNVNIKLFKAVQTFISSSSRF